MSTHRKPIRVLFVCMGNICRSAAAEIVFSKLVTDAGLAGAIDTDSAGTSAYHVGDPPDPRMAATLRARGYPIHGSARKVSTADFADFDLVLPMDEENERDLLKLHRNNGTRRARILPFVSFCTARRVRHVPDPYYGGPQGFEEVADIVEDACRGLLDHLRQKC
jgi:protein-tyrosine phosphatase